MSAWARSRLLTWPYKKETFFGESPAKWKQSDIKSGKSLTPLLWNILRTFYWHIGSEMNSGILSGSFWQVIWHGILSDPLSGIVSNNAKHLFWHFFDISPNTFSDLLSHIFSDIISLAHVLTFYLTHFSKFCLTFFLGTFLAIHLKICRLLLLAFYLE